MNWLQQLLLQQELKAQGGGKEPNPMQAQMMMGSPTPPPPVEQFDMTSSGPPPEVLAAMMAQPDNGPGPTGHPAFEPASAPAPVPDSVPPWLGWQTQQQDLRPPSGVPAGPPGPVRGTVDRSLAPPRTDQMTPMTAEAQAQASAVRSIDPAGSEAALRYGLTPDQLQVAGRTQAPIAMPGPTPPTRDLSGLDFQARTQPTPGPAVRPTVAPPADPFYVPPGQADAMQARIQAARRMRDQALQFQPRSQRVG